MRKTISQLPPYYSIALSIFDEPSTTPATKTPHFLCSQNSRLFSKNILVISKVLLIISRATLRKTLNTS